MMLTSHAPSRLANADALDVAVLSEEFADDRIVVELRCVETDCCQLGGPLNPHVVDVGPVADRLKGEPVRFLESGRCERVDAPFDHGEGPLVGDALSSLARGPMVGMSRHALWFEDDERGDVGREPVVDASVELSVGNRVETAVGKVEQRDLRDAEDSAASKSSRPRTSPSSSLAPMVLASPWVKHSTRTSRPSLARLARSAPSPNVSSSGCATTAATGPSEIGSIAMPLGILARSRADPGRSGSRKPRAGSMQQFQLGY